jgi:hypothetical protein
MKTFIFLSFLTFSLFCKAQTVKTGICIISSTKNYNEAKKRATAAASKLDLNLDLRDLVPNKKSGLTLSKAACKEEDIEYPAYYSRGADGEYVSIEYSNAFDGFAKGYYIVVAATGDQSVTQPALLKAKKIYKTAYVKQTDIYVGCSH